MGISVSVAPQGLGGGGVDGAISKAGGKKLLEARESARMLQKLAIEEIFGWVGVQNILDQDVCWEILAFLESSD